MTKKGHQIRIFVFLIFICSISFQIICLNYQFSWESSKDHVTVLPNWDDYKYRGPKLRSTSTSLIDAHEVSVPFLKDADLRVLDVFAASWWMRRERFVETKVGNIVGVEQDVFIPIQSAGEGRLDVRMTKDWLDFSLEHMSKWQKLIGTTTPGNSLVTNILWKYVSNREPGPSFVTLDTVMNTTLAIIPFGVTDDTPGKVQKVWVVFLTATITSLLQHGIKRIVVVGYYDMDAILTGRVFSYLLEKEYGSSILVNTTAAELPFQTFHIQSTELGFVHTTNVVTNKVAVNVPKGALVGLQEEFKTKSVPHNTKTMDLHPNNDTIGSYLGWNHVSKDFDHVFFTEADQILHARLSPVFLRELEQNRVLIPHRLQPIPHRDDMKPIIIPGSLKQLPDNHPPVIELAHSLTTDACCDSPEPYGEKTCASFWWICGYEGKSNFSYLEIFDFVRLSSGGTGVVTLAGNAHGRRCIAKPNGRGTC